MSHKKDESLTPSVLLIDLPVFPKGVLSLGLPLLAAHLRPFAEVKILDLNLQDWNSISMNNHLDTTDYVGFKVSSQNFDHAVELSKIIKESKPKISIIWGGEFPSLLPDKSLEFADVIVTKRIEGCLNEFVNDLKTGNLKARYDGSSSFDGKHAVPALDLQLKNGDYYSFMGMPFETSTGCDRFCRFCMVHTMQAGMKYKRPEDLRKELNQLDGKFVNILDYNIGVSLEHLVNVCREIQNSGATGWMGEMCLETLDNEEVLEALRSSRCKMIYCGLESLSEEGLKSVNKHKTNHPDNYRRIIRKAQSYGVNIASGFIIGLDGASKQSFDQMMDFYNEVGIEYVKFTFLTYNPGTYFYEKMQRSGTYTTEDVTRFDGNHLTYLANGLDEIRLYKESLRFVKEFYSIRAILRRSLRGHKSRLRRWEFILFNLCFREAYQDWIEFDVLTPNSTGIKKLMNKAFSKSRRIILIEFLLNVVRTKLYERHIA